MAWGTFGTRPPLWLSLGCSEVVSPPNGGGLSSVQLHCHLSPGTGDTSRSCGRCAGDTHLPHSLLPFTPDVCPHSSSLLALEMAPLPAFPKFLWVSQILWVWFLGSFPKGCPSHMTEVMDIYLLYQRQVHLPEQDLCQQPARGGRRLQDETHACVRPKLARSAGPRCREPVWRPRTAAPTPGLCCPWPLR